MLQTICYNFKRYKKEGKELKKNGKIFHIHGFLELICENGYSIKNNLRIQLNLYPKLELIHRN